jgi:hypothetical protein
MPGKNAYGSKAARDKALDMVDRDIYGRDGDDAYQSYTGYRPYPQSARQANNPKLNDMAQAEAVNRLVARSNRRKRGSVEAGTYGKPTAAEVKAGDAQRKRLMDRYSAKPDAAASYTGSPTPTPGQSAQSANRIAAQEAAEMKAMKMKKGGKVRKYADGGIVVSRGADDISRFRLGMMDDTPMTTGIGSPAAVMAADAMAMNEDMSSGPAMETPKVRRNRVRGAGNAPRNTARVDKPETQPALTAADRSTMRNVLNTPMAKPASKAPASPRVGIQNTPAIARYVETVKQERKDAANKNQATVERYISEGRIPTARAFAFVSGADFEAAQRNVARAPKAPATRGMSDAEIRRLTASMNADADRSVAARRMASLNDVAAVDAALRRQMQGRGPLAVRPRAQMALKDGGSVKTGCRGKSNMAMMAKALKGK